MGYEKEGKLKQFKSIRFVSLKFPVSNLGSASGLGFRISADLIKKSVVILLIRGSEMLAAAPRWLTKARRRHIMARRWLTTAHEKSSKTALPLQKCGKPSFFQFVERQRPWPLKKGLKPCEGIYRMDGRFKGNPLIKINPR
jgi:hypothetical protein